MSKKKKAIFLIGCPRSGTTVLQSLLACSPDIETFKETHFFSKGFFKYRSIYFPKAMPNQLVTQFENDNGINRNESFEGFNLFNILAPKAIARFYMRQLFNAAEKAGKPVFLEKTPRHLQFIDLIEHSEHDDTEIHFLHIFRNGIDTAASLYKASKAWGVVDNLPIEALQRWQQDIYISTKYIGNKNHSFVCYEDLIKHPSEIAKSLAKQVNIELTNAHLESRGESFKKIVKSNESWKLHDNGGQIKNFNRTSNHIDQATQDYLSTQIDNTGYEALLKYSRQQLGVNLNE